MKTIFAVYVNRNHRYVMAYICAVCNVPSVAFGDEPYGMFTGVCSSGGHSSTVMAS